MPDPRLVLFLCTGNYYRSRFAEALFNHVSAKRGLDWRAESRGLAIERGEGLPGNVSPLVTDALADRGIPVEAAREPAACGPHHLAAARMIIALNRDEHRHLLATRFPGWEDRAEYWLVQDVGLCRPADALAEIERRVHLLVDELACRSDDS